MEGEGAVGAEEISVMLFVVNLVLCTRIEQFNTVIQCIDIAMYVCRCPVFICAIN